MDRFRSKHLPGLVRVPSERELVGKVEEADVDNDIISGYHRGSCHENFKDLGESNDFFHMKFQARAVLWVCIVYHLFFSFLE